MLALVAVVGLVAGADRAATRLGRRRRHGRTACCSAAGLLFFAFAGYARIATLGEEVRDPARTIPRAIPLALGVVLAVYLVVAVVALWGARPASGWPRRAAPLADVVDRPPGCPVWPGWSGPVPRWPSLGSLLALLAGVGRTMLAMARDRRPAAGAGRRAPAFVRCRTGPSWRSAAVVIVLVALGDLRGAIGFSSFAVLVYYAITNASALTLGRTRPGGCPSGRSPRWGWSAALLLAVNLPTASVLAGFGVLALGALWYALRPGR